MASEMLNECTKMISFSQMLKSKTLYFFMVRQLFIAQAIPLVESINDMPNTYVIIEYSGHESSTHLLAHELKENMLATEILKSINS